ncbi:unnamed protein product [Rotaria socialis]|uniref:Uncharacterized protein n=2 Tax=Rotaria TaxID=231623 RepID=A0A820C6E5_9BILA|nr:unnamed protein product [Rotaria magnacalcarata]CAF3159149.1 unnamed protein product [Rotaria socialis]CAF1600958.1 unnamed protein product [Rotaria magnacalcarata]CAF2079679.1 unnamed protein product [Rotaria magnacalcarata]CAF2130375.1 unnamed protein product [Rotaria magnacalcarata]
MEENIDINPCSVVSRQSKRQLSHDDEKTRKKPAKRSPKRCSNEKVNEKNQVPIFTDAFLDLFRKQKSEIRSLKLTYNQLSESFKLKDAQQEQIRLDNQKMRLDIEEISQKNYFLKNQIDQIQQQFKELFHQEINKDFFLFLRQNPNDQDIQNKIQQIVKSLQL